MVSNSCTDFLSLGPGWTWLSTGLHCLLAQDVAQMKAEARLFLKPSLWGPVCVLACLEEVFLQLNIFFCHVIKILGVFNLICPLFQDHSSAIFFLLHSSIFLTITFTLFIFFMLFYNIFLNLSSVTWFLVISEVFPLVFKKSHDDLIFVMEFWLLDYSPLLICNSSSLGLFLSLVIHFSVSVKISLVLPCNPCMVMVV